MRLHPFVLSSVALALLLGGHVLRLTASDRDDINSKALLSDANSHVTAADNVPPEGFTPLFNGRDLSGWYGLGGSDWPKIHKLSPEARAKIRRESQPAIHQHWRVEDGILINDGKGPYLTTDKDYGDIELWVDFKIVPKGDSGIYLRGTPQVQVWDTTKEGGKWRHGADKGSGSLWNNKKTTNAALVHADRPIGEWNRFHIRMIGPLTTVHLNGQLVVDNLPLENYWDRSQPLFATGPIQLQTHGGKLKLRNIFVREIPADEANAFLESLNDDGFHPILNGRDLQGWVGAKDSYETKPDGVLACKKGTGGFLLTEKAYDDFAFRFEFRLPPGGNNGIAIRAPLDGNPAYAGMEIQVLDDTAGKYKDLKPWQFHGSVYGIAPSTPGFLRPTGQWNFEEIEVRGSQVTVRLNGTVINQVDLDKVRPIDGKDHPGRTRRSGHLGLLGHGDPVEFRNLRVRELAEKN
ncbi:MAG: DUF1080 domain-containing protein [Pirellulales bacterium]